MDDRPDKAKALRDFAGERQKALDEAKGVRNAAREAHAAEAGKESPDSDALGRLAAGVKNAEAAVAAARRSLETANERAGEVEYDLLVSPPVRPASVRKAPPVAVSLEDDA